MSKAFTKDDGADADVVVPQRPPLPPGVPNYVTPRGLAALRAEHARLAAERARAEAQSADGGGDRSGTATPLAALNERVTLLEERIAQAELVDPARQPRDEVRFGAAVTLRGEGEGDTTRRWRIVGVDEADPARGDIAFTSPLARALLGKAVGDEARVRTPGGSEARASRATYDVAIVAIDYDD